MTLQEIADALEKATGPNHRLDAEIYVAVGDIGPRTPNQTFSGPCVNLRIDEDGCEDSKWLDWEDENGEAWTKEAPELTASLDAAVALTEWVLPGWWWSLECFGRSPPDGRLRMAMVFTVDCKECGAGDTPAIALCLATIRALIAKGDAVEAMNEAEGRRR